jgi:hypothetical protein
MRSIASRFFLILKLLENDQIFGHFKLAKNSEAEPKARNEALR